MNHSAVSTTPPPVVEDEELAATAAEIRRLQKQISDLRAIIADQAQQLDARQSQPAPRQQIAVRVSISESETQKMLDDGWRVLYMQFAGRDLHAVFVRGARVALSPAFPIAAAIMDSGLDAVEADMDEAAFAAGRAAYEARVAANPQTFRAIPARVPGQVNHGR